MGNGGNRLRPLLTVLMARLLGYGGNDIYALAAAMEMFHVATLLHDDVMDNAELRRGHGDPQSSGLRKPSSPGTRCWPRETRWWRALATPG